jgi:Tol biopolymer transport system component
MGEVYRARDPKLGREIAIKVLPSATASDPDRRQRFEQEARSASALNHPNILTIYDIGEADGTVYIAMELIEGKTLRELVASGDALPTKKLLDLAVQIADGLAKAHSAGIVHRDLKPENIMVSRDGFAKILDFGLAKLTETAAQGGSVLPTAVAPGTAPGTVMGTVGYMSPEQASGEPVDFRSDQFSLGSILYEMATGKRPFQRKTAAETLVAIIREEPEPLQQAAPRAPAPVRWIVERCLAKDPEERYASSKDLARDLRAFQNHLSETSASSGIESAAPARIRRRRWLVPAALALLVGVIAGGLLHRWVSQRAGFQARFQQLTFQRGFIGTARFAPDGQSVVLGAAWEGRPLELYSTRFDSAESRSLGLPRADLLSISSNGEMAISLNRQYTLGFESTGTLARMPLGGGAPRAVLENVQDADWSPDGKTMAVARRVANGYRLEYPIGKPVYDTVGWVSCVRVSPDGASVAFADHPLRGDNFGTLKVVDRTGRVIIAGQSDRPLTGLAWSPDGSEVWYTEPTLNAISLSGRMRVVLSYPALATIQDIGRDGRVLMMSTAFRREIVGGRTDQNAEHNLTWLDWSLPVDLSRDGTVLFDEQQVRPRGIYARTIDGSPAVRLGDGYAFGFSPDGRRALATNDLDLGQLAVLPVGAGPSTLLPRSNLRIRWANYFPDGRRILILANEPSRGARLFVQDLSSGPPRPISPEGVTCLFSQAVSPDGESVAALSPELRITIYPTRSGEARLVPGVGSDEVCIRWTADGNSLYVYRSSLPPGHVDVVDVRTGRRTPWRDFRPPDPSGVQTVGPVAIAPDGSSYVYSYRRMLGDLYLAKGLK